MAQPIAFTPVGTATQPTHSLGGGYNPHTKEFWYPQWETTTIHKYDASHNPTGTLTAPVSSIVQLWMDQSSSDYYTANFYSSTITRISGNNVFWTYPLGGSFAVGVTTSDSHVYAMAERSATIVVLDKTTGIKVKDITLPGAITTRGGMVYANEILYVSGIANGFSTVPNVLNAIHAFDASTGAYISSIRTTQLAYNTAFDGETIWISNMENTIEGYKVSDGNAYSSSLGSTVTLTVTDAAGNTATKTAKVIVKDITVPVITIRVQKYNC